jgi:hypothetical protein
MQAIKSHRALHKLLNQSVFHHLRRSQDFKIFFLQFLRIIIMYISFSDIFSKIMGFEKKNTDNWYGQQVFEEYTDI